MSEVIPYPEWLRRDLATVRAHSRFVGGALNSLASQAQSRALHYHQTGRDLKALNLMMVGDDLMADHQRLLYGVRRTLLFMERADTQARLHYARHLWIMLDRARTHVKEARINDDALTLSERHSEMLMKSIGIAREAVEKLRKKLAAEQAAEQEES